MSEGRKDLNSKPGASSKTFQAPGSSLRKSRRRTDSGDQVSDLYSILNLRQDGSGSIPVNARTDVHIQPNTTNEWTKTQRNSSDREFTIYSSDGEQTTDLSRRSGGSNGKGLKMFGSDGKYTRDKIVKIGKKGWQKLRPSMVIRTTSRSAREMRQALSPGSGSHRMEGLSQAPPIAQPYSQHWSKASASGTDLDIGLGLAVGTSGKPALGHPQLGSSWSQASGYHRKASGSDSASHLDSVSVVSAPNRVPSTHKPSVLQQVKAKLNPSHQEQLGAAELQEAAGGGDSPTPSAQGSENSRELPAGGFAFKVKPPVQPPGAQKEGKVPLRSVGAVPLSQDELELLENTEFTAPPHLTLEHKRLMPVSSASNLKHSIAYLAPSPSNKSENSSIGMDDASLKQEEKKRQMQAHVEKMLRKWNREPLRQKQQQQKRKEAELAAEMEAKLRKLYDRTRSNEKRAKDLYKRIENLRKATQTDINAVAIRIDQLESDLYRHNVQLVQKEQESKNHTRKLRHRLEADVDEKIAIVLKAKEEGFHLLIRQIENRMMNIEAHVKTTPWFDGMFHRSIALGLSGAGAIVSIVAGVVTMVTAVFWFPLNFIRGEGQDNTSPNSNRPPGRINSVNPRLRTAIQKRQGESKKRWKKPNTGQEPSTQSRATSSKNQTSNNTIPRQRFRPSPLDLST